MFWNKKPDTHSVTAILRGVIDPVAGMDIVTAGLVGGIVVDGSDVIVTLDIDPVRHDEMALLRDEAQSRLRDIRGIDNVTVVMTAERAAAPPPPSLPPVQKPVEPQRLVAPQVKHIIALASGKGGVGKSTMAVNLAIALQRSGLNVGVLDADVYGPSVPMLLGLRSAKPEQADGYLIPLEAHGLKVMSMGFMVDEEAPMVWRGPMVQSALLQMLRDVKWGVLDILVIDMPPGTGDTQLTIAQRVKLSGAVIVSTPQDIALLDTVKGVQMFEKVSVPILGIVENMSVFTCPHCQSTSPIFGEHGARRKAAQLGIDVLGEIPLDMGIRENSDNGTPIVLDETAPAATLFAAIARQVRDKLDGGQGQRPPPRIVIEPAAV